MSTGIEWTDETWNPVTGCDRVSPGCAACYIERTPPFRMEGRRFDEHGRMGIRLHPDRLEKPLHWRKPRRVFVNSLSDLFHQDVPDEYIAKVWQAMATLDGAPVHTYQVLTKRPQRMAKLLAAVRPCEWGYLTHDGTNPEGVSQGTGHLFPSHTGWPLPNVWLGTSVENQRYADLRIPHLLATPAAVRFLSIEPLLGPVDLRAVGLGGCPDSRPEPQPGARIDWVIVGGESGPGARPMHPDWVRTIRDQCVAAGVPFFFKQWGEWAPGAISSPRVGKKAAGRVLDGRTWDEYPEAVPA